MINLKNSLVILSSLTLLSGCFEGRINTKKLCEENPALRCEQLNMNDGQCRHPRTNLIWHRHVTQQEPTIANKIQEFHFVDEYQKCLELAAQIEPTKPGNKKENRFNALMSTYKEQERLLEEIGHSDSPSALYFMWTKGDNRAKVKFLSLEGSGKLQTAELQYALATYYITRDKEKTVVLLENALTLTKADQLNSAVIESLASVNQSLGHKRHAYIWVMVARELELPIASDRHLAVLYPFSEKEAERLQEIATNITDALKDGQYKKNMLPAYAEK
ncbi:DUF2989 domain-containing protein [Vibrio sp. HA2012]|uniref:DUF2989 domain-containing protein n=1 Tax=Vibrio sp. HA2012 TaxID=1971595 RepID=UPI000C2C1D19|nr:DUF2989 domain-containing protein [Vibrio sp. HA2012]PJC88212.1 DUF2989 domain-containing protein [Vibrio sp. HA2012]